MTRPIRIALVGIGNCASALVQGIEFYKNNGPGPGLMNWGVGPYTVEDLEFSAAFDVNENKIGLDLSQAITVEPNCTIEISAVPLQSVPVRTGVLLDGIGENSMPKLKPVDTQTDNIAQVLRSTETDVLVNYLPVGSEVATRLYADAALEAKCGFVNSIPVFLASDPTWSRKFLEAGSPLIGDDIKSQVGATIVHRALAQLFSDRGAELTRTYQLNVGGNMDFWNMLDRSRLTSKRESKSNAVLEVANRGRGMNQDHLHIGPSDHIAWLDDQKIAFIRLEGLGFGGAPLEIELRMKVWDSPNSAGVVIDAIRYAKIALDRKIGGPIEGVCAWLMKSPPVRMADEASLDAITKFLVEP